MKKLILFSLISSFLILIFLDAGASHKVQGSYTGWKAGVAKVVITPEHPLWMAGYANRDHPSEGTLNDLWAKALALEDAKGNQSVLVTMDLRGIPKGFSDRIRDKLKSNFGLSRPQVILNVSHTHSGPVLTGVLLDIYPIDSIQQEKVKKYTDQLEGKIVALVGDALHSIEPVQLYSGNGVAYFQVNRRNNTESTLNLQTQLNGPNDYSVPVIKVVGKSGKLLAIAFGYACHNNVLNGYKWSGDYAGFAQIELEKAYPGTTALFFQGCGGDQNPLPRRSVALAEQYGETLASAVKSVLKEDMRELPPRLSASYREIELPLSTPPTKAELLKMVKTFSGYQKRWATLQLKKIEQGGSLMTSYPYPLQIWRLGDQTIMTLGGEPVIEYAIQLKRIFGQDVFVLGYCNDRMGYIPSTAILQEGGYEGASSIMGGSELPSTWASNIETMILSQMVQLAQEAGIPKNEFGLTTPSK